MKTEKEKKTGRSRVAAIYFAMLVALTLFLSGGNPCFASTVVLQWNAVTDVNLSGYKIYYQADSATLPFAGTGSTQGASPLNVSNQTSATISGLDPSHAYYFAVTAYNSSGTESAYSNIITVPEMVSPTVSLTAPASGSSASGTVSVAASATDNVGVTKVEFYVNGALAATDTATPYVYSWNTSALAAGTYTLMAKAYDAAGNAGQSSTVSVSVVKDTTAPTVSVTSPAGGVTLTGTAVITASASDNVGVSKVEFYGNGVLLSSTNVTPYSYTWNTASAANGSYTLTAKAYDAAGNIGTSSSVLVTVKNTVADTTAPTVSISSPAASATVSGAATVTTTVSDNVGVNKVEFYVNGALQATDTASPYSFSWNTSSLANGSYTLSCKAYDAAGNVGQSSSVPVTVNNSTSQQSSYTMWGSTVPGVADSGPDSAVEVGVKFRSDTNGTVTGIRFYKASTNTGTHVGNLWSSTGTKLATVTFTNETASGWQLMNFSTPVAITANTVYVASYHTNTGHYSDDQSYFSGKGMDSAPLHALADGVSGGNGVYAYGASSAFPSQTWSATNYWVDVVFSPATTTTGDTTAPAVSVTAPTGGSTVSGSVTVTATASDNVGVSKVEFYVNGALQATDTASPYSFSWNTASLSDGSYTLTAKAYDAAGNIGTSSSVSVTVKNTVADTTAPTVSISSPAASATVSGTATVTTTASDNVGVSKVEFYVNGALQATDTATPYSFSWNTSSLTNGSYTLSAKAYDAAGNVKQSTSVPVTVNNASTQSSYTIWGNAVPTAADGGADKAVELGVKFRSDSNGTVTGIRFYKASSNTGTHVGNLWSSSGTNLATVTFTNETASGWQQMNFSTPVAITANTVYVVSYHTNVGHYSADQNYFTSKGVDNAPLHALADGVSGVNGVYAYGSTSKFPSSGWKSSNYWVDVVFSK